MQQIKNLIKAFLMVFMVRFIKRVNATLILMFHDIGYEHRDRCSITPELFEYYLVLLKKWGYEFISLDDVLHQTKEELQNKKQAVVTFDDGRQGVYTFGYDLLKKYGIRPLIYLTSNYINNCTYYSYDKCPPSLVDESEIKGCNGFRINYLTDKQIEDLIAIGSEIGGHTSSHLHLTEVPDSLLEEEIATNKKELEERFGVSCKHFAYPFGDYNKRIVNAVRKYYRSAVTVEPRIVDGEPNPYLLPRIEAKRIQWDFIKLLRQKMKESQNSKRLSQALKTNHILQNR